MNDGLRRRIEELAGPATPEYAAAMEAFHALMEGLNAGTIRAATRDDDGAWQAHAWVKKGILMGFRLGRVVDFSRSPFAFFDKDTFPPRNLTADAGVRLVPGGSAIRSGAYVARGVVCMPPMYVNVGAYVDEGTMIDSHALVGSCAQIGRRVHLSAAAQIGGVIEPVGALPVIVEDDVFVGGGCGLYEGCLVREGAVLAPGVVLTRATRIYDTVHERVIAADADGVLGVPSRAVVVPGARAMTSSFGASHGLSLYAPVIVKYRDARTDAATTLESALRGNLN